MDWRSNWIIPRSILAIFLYFPVFQQHHRYFTLFLMDDSLLEDTAMQLLNFAKVTTSSQVQYMQCDSVTAILRTH